jgi:protocatechuate 3,4-dioxygenase beta subunit
MNDAHRFTRSQSLRKLFGAAALMGSGAAWKLAESEDGSAAVAQGLVRCVLTPELTEGPYYVAGEKLRRDITEGTPGTPLSLQLRVLNARTCKVMKNAVVEIWHCDALGVYSGAVAGNSGTNFLRGLQRTNASGIATFTTIYPGFYQGRAVHIHVKVHAGGNVVHTGQLFFPAAVTNAVYARAPYSRHGKTPDTPNASDSIFRNGGGKGMLKLTKHGAGYVGAITMGVSA